MSSDICYIHLYELLYLKDTNAAAHSVDGDQNCLQENENEIVTLKYLSFYASSSCMLKYRWRGVTRDRGLYLDIKR